MPTMSTSAREVVDGWDTSLDPTTAPVRNPNFKPREERKEELMPRGVYDRSKAAPRKKSGRSKSTKRSSHIMEENGKFFCSKCGYEGKDKKDVSKHIRNSHPKSDRRKAERRNDDGRTEAQEQVNLDSHAAYIFGKVETIIEYYANSNRISKPALTERVASLLRH